MWALKHIGRSDREHRIFGITIIENIGDVLITIAENIITLIEHRANIYPSLNS